MKKTTFILSMISLNLLFAFYNSGNKDDEHLSPDEWCEKDLRERGKRQMDFERGLIMAQEALKESDCNDEDRELKALDERY